MNNKEDGENEARIPINENKKPKFEQQQQQQEDSVVVVSEEDTSKNEDNGSSEPKRTGKVHATTEGEWVDPFYKFSEKPSSIDPELVSDEKNWAIVEWDQARESVAKSVLGMETQLLSTAEKERYEQEASEHWEKFYSFHKEKFFRDRTYLHLEFAEYLNPLGVNRDDTPLFLAEENTPKPPLTTPSHIVVEAGCGVGNTAFPLLKLNPQKYFYVFDFSPSAINLVKANPLYDESRISAFVCDIATTDIPIPLPPVDIVLMVFFLSAVSFEKMPCVLKRIYECLKPGGVVLFRDYGLYDMTQMRFVFKQGRKIDDNFYLRADGTRAYYFSTETLIKLFEEQGFTESRARYDCRELKNRKRKLSMYRVWVQGAFRKPLAESSSSSSSTTTTTTTIQTPDSSSIEGQT